MNHPHAQQAYPTGTPVEELDTPAVVVDLDIMEANIRKMQQYCDDHGIALRVHVKTHKIPALGELQRAAGARGISCQKLGEAEVFADAGFDDIFIPYNIVGPAKLARLMALQARARVSVAADSAAVVEGLAEAASAARCRVPVLIECDTGMGRTGVQTPAQAADLARIIDAAPALEFAGLMTFPTHMEHTPPFLEEALHLLEAAGIAVPMVSGGGTPQAWRTHEIPHINEHRAGTYIYNDANTVAWGTCTVEECAMRIRATVVSRPTPERAILDSGSKTLSADRLHGQHASFGILPAYPGAVIYGYSEEHGNVDLSACEARPTVGEVVEVIPNHCCMVSNLHDVIYGVRGGRVEQVWPVAARGLVR